MELKASWEQGRAVGFLHHRQLAQEDVHQMHQPVVAGTDRDGPQLEGQQDVDVDTVLLACAHAEADLESGIKEFLIQRDGQDLAQVPEKPAGKFGKPLFQGMSYHDTPEKPLLEMRFVDKTAKPGQKHVYRLITVNGAGLKAEPSQPASIR